MNKPNNTRKINSQSRGPPDRRPGHPRAELRFARGWRCRIGKTSPRSRAGPPLGRRFRLVRGLGTPPSGIPPRSGAGRPLERGPVSIESWAPPRADFRLTRGHHGPAASISAPPTGEFNALAFAGARVKDESMPRHAWGSRPGTAPPTPSARRSPPLCDAVRRGQQLSHGTVPPTLVRPTRRTLEKGRQIPQRGDERLLHARTGLRRDVRPVGGHLRRHRPCATIPATASPSPTLWERAATGRRHAGYCASYGLTSTAPSSPHAGGHWTGDLHVATLEAAPGRAQDAPWRPARSKIHQDGRLLRGAIRHSSTRR
jgi:hypothetical protein